MELQISNYCNCGKSFLYPEPIYSDAKNLKELKKEKQIKTLIPLMKICHNCYKKDKFEIIAYEIKTEKNYILYKRKQK
jgi:hypothetical protein